MGRLLMIARGGTSVEKALYDSMSDFELVVAPEAYSPLTYLFTNEEYVEVLEAGSDVDKVNRIAAAFAALTPAYTAATDTWFFTGDGKIIGYVIAEAFNVDGEFTSIGGAVLTRAVSVPTLPPLP